MANPVADSYVALSGADVYGGRFPAGITGTAALAELDASGALSGNLAALSGSADMDNLAASGSLEGTPAWRAGLTALQWAEVGGNTIASIDPAADAAINGSYPSAAAWDPHGTGIAGIMTNWSGGAWNEADQLLWVFGGGHAGYLANNGYSIDLDAGSPIWARRGYPTGSIQKPGNPKDVDGSGWGVDGRPLSTHTRNGLCALPNGDIFFSANAETWQPALQPSAYVWDAANDDYAGVGTDYAGSYAGVVGTNPTGGSCYDSANNLVWYFGGGGVGVVKYDIGAKAAPAFVKSASLGSFGASRYMPDTALCVFFNSNADANGTGKSILVFDPANPTATMPGITCASNPIWAGDSGYGGIAYCSTRRTFYYWNGGATVEYLEVPADPKTGTWVYGTLSTSTAVVTPSAASANGVFGRFSKSDKYDCLIGVNKANEHLFVLPLS